MQDSSLQPAPNFPCELGIEQQLDETSVAKLSLVQPREDKEKDFVGNHDFGKFRKTESCIELKEYVEYHHKRMSEKYERGRSSFNIHSLDENLITFLVSVNRLLRVGADCEFCPMCCKRKQHKVESHIFPRGLLMIFKQIHCSNCNDKSSDKYIYDFSRGVWLGVNTLTYPMLCSDCEQLCDEKSLRQLYIILMDKADKKGLTVPNDRHWLQRVLANIILRGLLVTDSLPNDFLDADFKRVFKTLWDYCATRDSMLPDLHLFLLPNRPLVKGLNMYVHSFEYTLRCPMLPKVFRDQELGIYFVYTKFDYFHVVLPLNNESIL